MFRCSYRNNSTFLGPNQKLVRSVEFGTSAEVASWLLGRSLNDVKICRMVEIKIPPTIRDVSEVQEYIELGEEAML
jgi:uncharacterized phage protein gp47/JayE